MREVGGQRPSKGHFPWTIGLFLLLSGKPENVSRFFSLLDKRQGRRGSLSLSFFTEEQFSPSAFNNRGSFGLRSFYTSDMKGKPAL